MSAMVQALVLAPMPGRDVAGFVNDIDRRHLAPLAARAPHRPRRPDQRRQCVYDAAAEPYRSAVGQDPKTAPATMAGGSQRRITGDD
jgi:hypothetical protein